MRKIFKFFIIFFLSLSLANLIVQPVLAIDYRSNRQSATNDTVVNKAETTATSVICNNLSKFKETITSRLTARKDNLDQKQDNRVDNLSERIARRDQKLAENRKMWDERKASHYERLEGLADTDEEKQAITTFRQTVDAAVSVRRAKKDQAIADFRAAVSAAVKNRQDSINIAAASYQSAVAAAFDQAQSSCDSGADGKTIRATLHIDLKAARDQFNTNRQAVDKIGDDISALAQTKNQAIELAREEFQTILEQARETLKAKLTPRE